MPIVFTDVTNPPRVVATSHALQGISRSGPDVAVPTAWQQSPSMATSNFKSYSSQGGPQMGYSSNHAIYASERERWSKMAYMGPPAETISLDISAIHDAGPKRKNGRGTTIAVCILGAT